MKGNTLFVAVGGLIIAGGILLGLYWSYSSASSSESDNALAPEMAVGGRGVHAPVNVPQARSQSNFSPKSNKTEDISHKFPNTVSETKTKVVDTIVEPEARESVTLNTAAKSETFVGSSSEMDIEEFEVKPNAHSSAIITEVPAVITEVDRSIEESKNEMENEDTNVVFGSNGVEFSLENIQSDIFEPTVIQEISFASNTRESSVTSEETKSVSSEEASNEAVSLASSSLSDISETKYVEISESLPSNNEFFILEQSKKEPEVVRLLYSNAQSEIVDLVKVKNVLGIPKVSPNGRQMCFCRQKEIFDKMKRKIATEIVRMDLEHLELEPEVIVTNVRKCDFNFTPSSDAIIIPKGNEIVKVGLFGFHPETTIFTFPFRKIISNPTYSHDGSILYFISGLKVYRKLPDQENAEHFINVIGNLPESFEVSSDNKRFIFKNDNYSENKIEVIHVDGDNVDLKTITIPDEKIKEAFFAKDGQTVYIRTVSSVTLEARLHKLGPEDLAPKPASLPEYLKLDQVHSIILK